LEALHGPRNDFDIKIAQSKQKPFSSLDVSLKCGRHHQAFAI
jgi:hypothetical protein